MKMNYYQINYYNRKYYNNYLKSLCNIINYNNICDKKATKQFKKNPIFKSDKYLIKKLKLDNDTDSKVFTPFNI